jgi:ribonuclease J
MDIFTNLLKPQKNQDTPKSSDQSKSKTTNEDYKLRFIPLGGVIGVTKNMYVYEIYKSGELQDILIVDCGIGFPQEKELGVDFVIPDITYLKDKVDKIRAIVLTHGHEDHISALPFHYKDLGQPPVYTSKLTMMFVKNKFKEFNQSINIFEVSFTEEYKFGGFKVSFIPMTHSIPDAMHVLIKTPVGLIYHGPDYKMDLTPPMDLLLIFTKW